MPLAPEYTERAHLLEGIDSYLDALSDPEKHARLDAFAADPPWATPDVSIEDATVPGPHGPVPIRTYRDLRAKLPSAGLVWAHGGGWAGGDLDMNEAHVVSAELAMRSGAMVISVDYRLAKDGVHYPIPLDDVSAVWQWAGRSAGQLGINSARLFIGGASAGANLAAGAVLRSRASEAEPAQGVLLAYPAGLFMPAPLIDDATIAQMPPMFQPKPGPEVMVLNYLGDALPPPTDAMPGHAESLAGLPPFHILVAEYDGLRPQGELFAERLRAEGVPVTTYLAEGVLHGHLNRTPALAEMDRSLDYFAAVLRG